jgi:hypothetical protein
MVGVSIIGGDTDHPSGREIRRVFTKFIVLEPPGLIIETTLQDMKIGRAFEQFSFAHHPTVPIFPTTFKYGIIWVLRDHCWVAGRCGGMHPGPVICTHTQCNLTPVTVSITIPWGDKALTCDHPY